MNVDHVKEVPPHGGLRLAKMIEHQRTLMKQYCAIEVANGLRATGDRVPVNVDDRLGQYVIKDFAWRFTEEITEAAEALEVHPDLPQHALEELADAAHFLLEMTIIAGLVDRVVYSNRWTGTEMPDALPCLVHFDTETEPRLATLSLDELFFQPVRRLGEAMNCLKNKPWKQTHVLTDRPRFTELILDTYEQFFRLFGRLGLDCDQVYTIYFKKAAVNEFRIRSKY